MTPDAELLSAQVVVRDAAAAAAASRWFRDAGFELGPFVGASFAISGPRSLVERVFGHLPDPSRARGEDLQLDLAALPAEARSAVETIAFTSPPDFGPTGP